MEADGSFVVTKHLGTGGLVSIGTVTAQLLYELGEPSYANPDAIARFDSIRLDQGGADRAQGMHQLRGRLPQRDDARAHWSRRGREGRGAQAGDRAPPRRRRALRRT